MIFIKLKNLCYVWDKYCCKVSINTKNLVEQSLDQYMSICDKQFDYILEFEQHLQ